MSAADGLPRFPDIRLELLEDLSPIDPTGFLRLLRRRCVAHYPDGTTSAPFVYDEVTRNALDAVVVAAHYRGSDGHYVFLRSALRPPIALRERGHLGEPDRGGALWELPAGLVEADEWSPEGVRRSAQRELLEETGFDVELATLSPLGPSTYPAPGICAERHIYFEVEVDPSRRQEPSLDGSALERGGVVVAMGIARALELCATGAIEDAKTELALRRLSERLA
jgi:ADP-ribose pyrophosphatase